MGPLPFALLDERARETLRRTVFGLIDRVGAGDTRRDRSAVVLHARRRLSDRELAMLSPAWCALPAIDIAGGDTPW
jgi:hypothetical protein